MSLNTFVQRTGRVVVTVQRPNTQGVVTAQTYTFVNNRMRVRLRDGGANFGNCHIQIYGATLAEMNNMARLYNTPMTPQSTDTVQVDVWNGKIFVPLFQGVISWSNISPASMPAVPFVIESNSSFGMMTTPASPYSNGTPVSLQDALSTIVSQAGYTLDYSPNAPQYMLQRVRLTGSVSDQVNGLLKSFPDLVHNTHLQRVVVWPASGPYSSTGTPVQISAATGMHAAPEYSTSGITFSTLFNPQIIPGAALQFSTQFKFIDQTQWVAHVIEHDLEMNVPQGKWDSSIAARAFGQTGTTQ